MGKDLQELAEEFNNDPYSNDHYFVKNGHLFCELEKMPFDKWTDNGSVHHSGYMIYDPEQKRFWDVYQDDPEYDLI